MDLNKTNILERNLNEIWWYFEPIWMKFVESNLIPFWGDLNENGVISSHTKFRAFFSIKISNILKSGHFLVYFCVNSIAISFSLPVDQIFSTNLYIHTSRKALSCLRFQRVIFSIKNPLYFYLVFNNFDWWFLGGSNLSDTKKRADFSILN